jgi:hypothetical protein
MRIWSTMLKTLACGLTKQQGLRMHIRQKAVSFYLCRQKIKHPAARLTRGRPLR